MHPLKSSKQTVLFAATGRSGSFLTCDLISQAGDLPFPDEYLNFGMLAASTAFDFPEHLNDAARLEYVMAAQRESHGLFACKVMWPVFAGFFGNKPDASKDEMRELGNRALELLGRTGFVWIRRRNRIAQAVSFEKARQSRIWTKMDHQTEKSVSLLYSYQRILTCLRQIEYQEAQWQNFFEANDLEYYEVWYEDLLSDMERHVDEALQFLGLPMRRPVEHTKYVRQSNALNKEWRTRFERRYEQKGTPPRRTGAESPDLCASLKILDQTPVVMRADSTRKLICSLSNEGRSTWKPSLRKDGKLAYGLELFKLGSDETPENEPVWMAELEEDLEPGQSKRLELRLRAESADHDFKCAVIFKPPEGQSCAVEEFEVKVQQTGAFRFFERVFGDAASTEVTQSLHVPGMIQVEGMGNFWTDAFPFIYQKDHGWFRVDEENSHTGTLYAHDFALGYFKWEMARSDMFEVHKPSGGVRRLRFLGQEAGQRRFHDVDADNTIFKKISEGDAAESSAAE